jgi:hypothetical protein
MRIAAALAFLLAIVLPNTVALAQPDPTREVQARYAECRALEKIGRPLEFQRAQAGNDLGPWEKRQPRDDVYELLRVHLGGNRVRSVRLEQSSPSGDWSSLTTYCFRTDGTLAFKFQTLRTFYHDEVPGLTVLEVELRSYVLPNGQKLKNLETMRDGASRKPVETTYMRNGGPDFPTSASVVKAVGAALLPAK